MWLGEGSDHASYSKFWFRTWRISNRTAVASCVHRTTFCHGTSGSLPAVSLAAKLLKDVERIIKLSCMCICDLWLWHSDCIIGITCRSGDGSGAAKYWILRQDRLQVGWVVHQLPLGPPNHSNFHCFSWCFLRRKPSWLPHHVFASPFARPDLLCAAARRVAPAARAHCLSPIGQAKRSTKAVINWLKAAQLQTFWEL